MLHRLSPFWSSNQQQAENQAKETKNELDLAQQQSGLEDGLPRLQTTVQRNQDQATRVKAQAESARRQAGGLEEVITPATATRGRHTAFL